MASIIKSDNGVSSGITGIVQSADSSGQLALQTTTSSGTATTAVTIDNSQNATFAGKVASAGSLQLATNGTTTALTLDAAQNAGLGVTPSAWTGGPATQFKYGGSVWNNSDSSFHISENAFYNGSWNYINGSSAAATNYQQSAGTHVWRYVGAGTGTISSWTTAMTLDGNSNLTVNGVASFGTSKTGNAYNGFYTADSSGSPGIKFFPNNTEQASIRAGAGTNGSLTFATGGVAGTYDHMTLDASGRLGIGTVSPAGPLDITNGSIQQYLSNATATGTATGTVYSTLAMRSIKGAGAGNFAYDDAWIQTQRLNYNYNGDYYTHDSKLVFFTNPSNRDGNPVAQMSVSAQGLALLNGNGIVFNNSSALTNSTLNDYETGTWTPNQGAGLTVVGTFSSSGTYTKIGNFVYVTFRVSGSTSVAAAATSVITTLPFVVYGSSQSMCAGLSNAYASVTSIANPSGSSFYSVGQAFAASSNIYGTAVYQTNF